MKNFDNEHRKEKLSKLAFDRHHAAVDMASRKKALDQNLRDLKAAEAEYTRAATALLERSDAATLKAFCLARAEKKRLQDERHRLWA